MPIPMQRQGKAKPPPSFLVRPMSLFKSSWINLINLYELVRGQKRLPNSKGIGYKHFFIFLPQLFFRQSVTIDSISVNSITLVTTKKQVKRLDLINWLVEWLDLSYCDSKAYSVFAQGPSLVGFVFLQARRKFFHLIFLVITATLSYYI